jgi:P-type Ca2+ transporter type 2C
MGKIGKALQALAPEPTPLQRDTRRLVRNLALIGFVLCLLVAILYGFTRDNWLGGLLAGITLAMAILPEEFPVVLTVFLALGAWRISRNHVLTRRVPAIETLGEATVLCVDKTGTLTQNRMAVKQIQAGGAAWEAGCGKPFPASLREVAEISVLASETDPFDPMEKAILELTKDHDERMLPVVRGLRLVHEYPLSRELLAVTHVWQAPDHEEFLVAAKGAPEAVLDLCRLDGAARQELAQQVASMAQRGLRVLGVAKAWYHGDDWPETPRRFNFRFVGLVGLADPIRPTVPRALEECYSAGIRVVMITGDYPGTAKAIAAQIGLHFRDEPITGIELEEMSDDELARRIKMVNIFARVLPEQKLRLVNAFKAIGDVVAMTGDGVNDAPALKAAHIGIAMGGRGTDVAREAASLVLLDDEFASIVKAVRLGRRIFDNLRKAMTYILAVHVPTVGMSFAPLLFGSPLVLFPVHIMFLEFVIDPACSVAFEAEPEEPDVMERPPRRPGEPLFSGAALWLGLLQGVVAWLAVLAVYGYSVHLGHNDRIIRAMTFSAIVAANLALIFANRSSRHTIIATLGTRNPALWWVVAVALASLGFALYVPWLAELFQFSPLRFDQLSLALAAGAASILWFEAFKWVKDSRAKLQAAQDLPR